MSRSVFVFGAGAAGGSLAVALSQRNVEIAGVYDIDAERARAIARIAGSIASSGDLPGSAGRADVALVAVPDPEIRRLASRVARERICGPSQIWLHVSGSQPAGALSPLGGLVKGIGAFHPALVFAPQKISEIPQGTGFAVDGDRAALDAASELARALGGSTVLVPAANRALYHTAMVMASNYVVALLAEAKTALAQTAIPEESIEPLLLSLTSSAVDRAAALGLEKALSGPIRRGDAQTVRTNLASLDALPQTRDLYRALGLATLRLARGSPGLTDEQLQAVEAALNTEKVE